ncbi:Tellurite resistance protein, TerB-like [Desulfonema limicola]|uniref:Tellurite resistance protein, TerB-like n=1 Tax=Desulfonema limicola TaxID=45656 RepID=A0A975B7I8_9BACT|nr:tellurite resistance TerB family protein [Desulfonema limicola]QTA80335.1 Tellurite resistance protein, TerB-like [Desulfonema limicola]
MVFTRIKKAKNKNFMEAVAAGSAMVAFADTMIRPEETSKLLDYARIEESLKVFNPAEIIETFEKYIENFHFDSRVGREKALKAIQKIERSSEEARLVVFVCCAIGSADGEFDNNQRLAVREICRVLGLNPEQFSLDLKAPKPENFPRPAKTATYTKQTTTDNIPEWMKNTSNILPKPGKHEKKTENMPEWMKNPPKIQKQKKSNKPDMPQWMKNPSEIIKQHQENKNIPGWMRKIK